MGWGQLDTGPVPPSHFRKRVFRPNPGCGIKGHLSVPRCPAPAFPNNVPLCGSPASRGPRPQHTTSFHCLCGRLVCLPCRGQAFCCSSLFSPPRAPSKRTLSGDSRVWGAGGGWGLMVRPPRRNRGGRMKHLGGVSTGSGCLAGWPSSCWRVLESAGASVPLCLHLPGLGSMPPGSVVLIPMK